jgi:hypothetical protein
MRQSSFLRTSVFRRYRTTNLKKDYDIIKYFMSIYENYSFGGTNKNNMEQAFKGINNYN